MKKILLEHGFDIEGVTPVHFLYMYGDMVSCNLILSNLLKFFPKYVTGAQAICH